MRPGIFFILLFVLLMGIHFSLVDRIGRIPTVLVQVAVTLVLLAAALGLRSRRGGP